MKVQPKNPKAYNSGYNEIFEKWVEKLPHLFPSSVDAEGLALPTAITKKEQYLEKVNSLKKLAKNIGTTKEINRITAIGALIETTNFLSLKPDRKKMLKENMIWCNKIYKQYIEYLDFKKKNHIL